MTYKKAFTLIELMVVVVIIGTLATVVTMNVLGSQRRANDARRTTDANTLKTALGQYYEDYGSYPYCLNASNPSSCNIEDNTMVPELKKYLNAFPRDPKDKTTGYLYTRSAANAYWIQVSYENSGTRGCLEGAGKCSCYVGVNVTASPICK